MTPFVAVAAAPGVRLELGEIRSFEASDAIARLSRSAMPSSREDAVHKVACVGLRELDGQ